MIRATSGGGGGAGHNDRGSHHHHHDLQGDEMTTDGGSGDDKFVYRVVGDHSPLWTTLTQAQTIADYES